MDDSWVDVAVQHARHNGWHEQARAEATYTPEPERWHSTADPIGGGSALVDDLRKRIVKLEEGYAWLERELNRLGLQLGHLTGADAERLDMGWGDRPDEYAPVAEPAGAPF